MAMQQSTKSRGGFVLFTINGDGESNPRSRQVVLDGRERLGQMGFVFPSVEGVNLRRSAVAGMVALFDMDCVGQPILSDEEIQPELVPSWARKPTSDLCFGICLITSQATVEVVRKITRLCEPLFEERSPILSPGEIAERERRHFFREQLLRREVAKRHRYRFGAVAR